MGVNVLRRRAFAHWAVVVLWGWLAGCATGQTSIPLGGRMAYENLRYRPATPQDAPARAARKRRVQPAQALARSAGPAGLVTRAVLGSASHGDAFDAVLGLAGLDAPRTDFLPRRR